MKQNGFVIYLIARNRVNGMNDYGYWRGTEYIHQYDPYPITDSRIQKETRIYKSKKVAENALKRCIKRYSQVEDGIVREL